MPQLKSNRSQRRITRGVYFLGNDYVLDLAIAFLESFREKNPSIRLCLIPFGGPFEHLLQLQSQYDFQVFKNKRCLKNCDSISKAFIGKRRGECRKLAMWEGPFDEFLYFDIDTVVLQKVDAVFKNLRSYDFIVAQSNLPEHFRYVWRPKALKANWIDKQKLKFSGTTGFMASRKKLLLTRDVLEVVKKSSTKKFIKIMALEFPDQALFNFLFISKKRPCSGLNMIAARNPTEQPMVELWAGALPKKMNPKIFFKKRTKPLFVHWAGLWQSGGHLNSSLWRQYRDQFK